MKLPPKTQVLSEYGFAYGLRTETHRNRSDFCDLRLRCPPRTPEIARFPRQEKAMLHCDLRVRWKVASDLRFRAAMSKRNTPSFCGISGDLAPSTRKSLAIAIVRFWCAKLRTETRQFWGRSPAASTSRPRATFWRGLLSGASVCYVAQLCLEGSSAWIILGVCYDICSLVGSFQNG